LFNYAKQLKADWKFEQARFQKLSFVVSCLAKTTIPCGGFGNAFKRFSLVIAPRVTILQFFEQRDSARCFLAKCAVKKIINDF